MAMPGRTYSPTSYRYGFNGKENDKDISEGWQDYGMRIYDSRIGKFLSVDPLTPKYPELTPYQFASNSPMENSDLDGLESLSEIKSGLARQQEMRMRVPQLNLINAQKEASWFRAMLNTYSQIPPSTFSKAPLYSASEQEKHDAFRAYKLSEAGYNTDGTPKPLTQLAENKTFNKFADNIALPVAEMAAGEGAGKLIAKGAPILFKSAAKLFKDAEF